MADKQPSGRGNRWHPKTTDEVIQDFWSFVDRSAEGCWEWQGQILSVNNYGRYRRKNPYGTERAHRIAWMIANGPIPKGMYVCHKCDNPPCVNPSHLFLGTQADNMQDMHLKGRGHAGESHANAKLSDEEVEIIRSNPLGVTQRELASKFGVSESLVSQIINNRKRVA